MGALAFGGVARVAGLYIRIISFSAWCRIVDIKRWYSRTVFGANVFPVDALRNKSRTSQSRTFAIFSALSIQMGSPRTAFVTVLALIWAALANFWLLIPFSSNRFMRFRVARALAPFLFLVFFSSS